MSSILIVEDERLVARDLEESLRQLGYEIAGSVASSEEALSAARTVKPDLVLMDIHIQGDLDGIETAKLLQRQHDAAVVYMTAYADLDTVTRAKETGPYGYVVKPVRTSEMQSAVEVALFKHQLDARLRERERWFSTTLRSIGDAVVAVDPDGHVRLANRVAEEILGQDEASLLGKPFADLFQVVDQATGQIVADPVGRALQRETVTLPLRSALNRPGAPCPIEDSAAPIVDESGRLLGAVVVFRDATDKRKIEQGMAVADRLASLGTLAAGMAHEINNPLSYIVSNGTFIADEIAALAEQVRPDGSDVLAMATLSEALAAAKDLLDGAERVRQIVADLRVFGRAADEEIGEVDPLSAVDWALRVTDRQIRQRARLVTELKELPTVRGNESRLGQVLVNLLTNAIHAIGDRDDTKNTIAVVSEVIEGKTVQIAVSDTGCGISPETMDHIFEPFFTTKPVGLGSGLGLAVCHGIVQAMGGTISVQSEVGVGSTFFVRLPVSTASQPEERSDAEPVPKARGKVLVVDDEPLVLRALSRIAAREHDVTSVSTVREAMGLIQNGQRFDVIVCDLMMPGLTGMDLYETLKSEFPELAPRVIFMTGGAFVPRAEEFLKIVSNPHMTKPVRPAELLGRLRQTLTEINGE